MSLFVVPDSAAALRPTRRDFIRRKEVGKKKKKKSFRRRDGDKGIKLSVLSELLQLLYHSICTALIIYMLLSASAETERENRK